MRQVNVSAAGHEPHDVGWMKGPGPVTLRWREGDDQALQMWASNGYDATRAQAGDGLTQVVDVGALDWIYVGLALGPNNQPQRLTKPTRFEIGVE